MASNLRNASSGRESVSTSKPSRCKYFSSRCRSGSSSSTRRILAVATHLPDGQGRFARTESQPQAYPARILLVETVLRCVMPVVVAELYMDVSGHLVGHTSSGLSVSVLAQALAHGRKL